MGTRWRIVAYAPQGTEAAEIEGLAEQCFAPVIASFSNWDDDSTVSRFNRARGGTSVSLSATEDLVIATALEIAAATDGAFDPCLGHRTDKLQFNTSNDIAWQSHALVHQRHWRNLEHDAGVIRQPGSIKLDLSAIAKGYAVDRVCEALSAIGIDACLAEIGGEFRATGIKPDLQPWWVGVDDGMPDSDRSCVAALADCAIATAGGASRVHRDENGTSCHIVPAPGQPAERSLVSISVVARSCMLADAWSTALYAAGVTRGIELADAGDVAALFQLRNGKQLASAAMKPLLDMD